MLNITKEMDFIMKKAVVKVDRDFYIGVTDKRIYGSFVEHIGRCVYGGIYDPIYSDSDDMGFRRDVLELTKELDISVVRYPGGNFVSGYNWEDGIGPKDKRPKRSELAWLATETNEIGTDEFTEWCRRANTKPMMAVNLGTGGPDTARNIVEYCNRSSGTYWSDLRIQNGYEIPHDIKLWCLGNEMDGSWQIGHKKAEEYARIALEAGKVMKLVDPEIELVACGSSSMGMPTFGHWETTVLEEVYDICDYISLHIYFGNRDDDLPNFLAKSVEMDSFINTVVSICDYIKGKNRKKKTINLSFDEWNIWYHSTDKIEAYMKNRSWDIAPAFNEDIYNFEDALLFGSMILSLLRRADRVKIACLAQLVNVIAPIITVTGGGSYKQSIYYPFLHASKFGRGKVLQTLVECDKYDSKDFCDVPILDTLAVENEENNELTVFAVNKDVNNDILASFSLHEYEDYEPIEFIVLHNGDGKAFNSVKKPDMVVPLSKSPPKMDNGILEVQFSKLSWNVLRIKKKGN